MTKNAISTDDLGRDAELLADSPTPQPEQAQELSTEQVRVLLSGITPGKWEHYAGVSSNEYHRGFQITNSEMMLGYVHALSSTGRDDDGTGAANAALMAASPTLARDLITERTAHAATRAENDRLRAALAEAEALAEEGRGVLKTLWVYLQYAERYHELDAQLLRSHRYTDKWRQALEARDTVGLDMDAALVEVLKIAPVRLEALATAQGKKGGA